ncbi:MAG: hypothetical protein NTY42_10575 [Planctomycetota bacterium]|nr:hypothetical protein [Planctomycetota bacterium]
MYAKYALIVFSILFVGCDSKRLDESNSKLDDAMLEIESLKAEVAKTKAEAVKKQEIAKTEIAKANAEARKASDKLQLALAAKTNELKIVSDKYSEEKKEFLKLVDKSIKEKKIRIWAAAIRFGELSDERQARALELFKRAKLNGPKSLDGWLPLLDGGTDEAYEMAYIASGEAEKESGRTKKKQE